MIVEQNLDNLVRFAFFRIGNQAVAEDLVHDAIVRLSEAKTTPRNVKTYLFKILYNLCLDFGKRQFESVPIVEIEEPAYSPEDETEWSKERQRIMRSLASLSDEKRQIVIMRAVDTMKFAEIADIMSAPITTVQYRYNAAIKELRTILTKSGDL